MKKINSEVNYKDENFKIKIGTTDKKNPNALSLEIGTYVMPDTREEPFKQRIENITKKTKQFAKTTLQESHATENNFIFIVDVAADRMAINKKTYLEFQIFLKPHNTLLIDKTFKNIADLIYNDFGGKILPYIKKCLTEEGFTYSKTK